MRILEDGSRNLVDVHDVLVWSEVRRAQGP